MQAFIVYFECAELLCHTSFPRVMVVCCEQFNPCASVHYTVHQRRRPCGALYPGARYLVPGTQCQVRGARYPVPATWCQVPGARCPVPGTRCQVRGASYPVPGARCQVPGARYPVPGTWCQVPGARCPVPGARCQVPGASYLGALYLVQASALVPGTLHLLCSKQPSGSILSPHKKPVPGP